MPCSYSLPLPLPPAGPTAPSRTRQYLQASCYSLYELLGRCADIESTFQPPRRTRPSGPVPEPDPGACTGARALATRLSILQVISPGSYLHAALAAEQLGRVRARADDGVGEESCC